MKYFSAFSGIGGFELGIGNRAECIGYSEIDKYAIEIYSHHFPNHKNYGDIKKIEAYRLPDFDIFVGGFPCPSFSVAGKRHGFADERGELFFDITRILEAKRPKIVVLENVKGLLSNKGGETFQVVLEEISKLGYGVSWVVINSKLYVPQNRERVFIVGHLGNEPGRQILPFNESTINDIEKGRTETDVPLTVVGGHQENSAVMDNMSLTLTAQGDVPTLINRQMKEPEIKKPIPKFDDSQTRFDEVGNFKVSRSISFRPREGIINKNNISYSLDSGVHVGVIETTKAKPTKLGNTNANGRTIKESDEDAFTLTANSPNGILENTRIRKLTPIECERLQGFPDNWTKINDISDTQRYKTLGNAVTVDVINKIFSELLPYQNHKLGEYI